MTPDKKQTTTEESAVQWLEVQLQETKAQLRRLEQRLGEATSQLLNLSNGFRRAEETLSSVTVRVAGLPALQEELRQVREQLEKIQDRQTAIQNRSEDLARQRQADLERERHDRGAIAKRVDVIDKLVGRYENRLQAIEEAVRHGEDEAAALRQGQQQLEHAQQELLTKANSSLESITRLEHELGRLANEVEALSRADTNLADRLNLAQEVVRRAEERVDQVERHLPTLEEIREFQKGSRFEREQFAERVSAVERSSEETSQRSKEFGQLLAALQQQAQAQATQILSLIEELQEHRQQVSEQLKRMSVIMERQKRRQAEALAQEIKELKQSDPTAGGQ